VGLVLNQNFSRLSEFLHVEGLQLSHGLYCESVSFGYLVLGKICRWCLFCCQELVSAHLEGPTYLHTLCVRNCGDHVAAISGRCTHNQVRD
jgi:hypothetical protein